MLFPSNNGEDLQKLDKAVMLQNEVKSVRLQDKLGEQNCHQNAEKLFINHLLIQEKVPLKIKQKL